MFIRRYCSPAHFSISVTYCQRLCILGHHGAIEIIIIVLTVSIIIIIIVTHGVELERYNGRLRISSVCISFCYVSNTNN